MTSINSEATTRGDAGAMSIDEADALEDLDDETGSSVEQDRCSSPIDLEASVAEMNPVGRRFLFIEKAATGHGNVVYPRCDGHYGLIEP